MFCVDKPPSAPSRLRRRGPCFVILRGESSDPRKAHAAGHVSQGGRHIIATRYRERPAARDCRRLLALISCALRPSPAFLRHGW
ncbi:hypothetical protein HYPGJ_31959 [Hyphomicrobium sp. GJ21]|nr:hypothetical protein HYPGJ_31959 [Hyphomicrobium sp. GJ21]